MTRKALIAPMLALLALLAAPAPAAPEQPVFTSTSVDFYGQATGRLVLRPGQVVTAYDPQGVLCGRCTVRERNLYGFLHVYGDDPDTPEDEGPRVGERISFRVNGRPVRCAGPEEPVWRGDGECINVNLKR